MRFAHLSTGDGPLAAVDGDSVAALSLDGIATVDELIDAGSGAWDAARKAGAAALENAGEPLRRGALGAPLKAPSKIDCVGLNYHDHCRETGMAAPDRPLMFAKFASSLSGPETPIEPSEREALDAVFEHRQLLPAGRGHRHPGRVRRPAAEAPGRAGERRDDADRNPVGRGRLPRPARLPRPGDTVEVEVEGVGVLSNHVRRITT